MRKILGQPLHELVEVEPSLRDALEDAFIDYYHHRCLQTWEHMKAIESSVLEELHHEKERYEHKYKVKIRTRLAKKLVYQPAKVYDRIAKGKYTP